MAIDGVKLIKEKYPFKSFIILILLILIRGSFQQSNNSTNSLNFLNITLNITGNETRIIRRYPVKYDYINVNGILKNERLLNMYISCIKGIGKCTPEGYDIRDTIPEIIQNNCQFCTNRQKKNLLTVVNHLRLNRPNIWMDLKRSLDPNETYIKEFEKNNPV